MVCVPMQSCKACKFIIIIELKITDVAKNIASNVKNYVENY